MIIFSDLHLEEKSADVALEVLRRIPVAAAAGNESHVAFLGDWWMVRHHIPVRLLDEANAILRTWPDLGIERFDVLVGNHDQYRDDGRNALDVFDGLDGFVHVHSEPGWTDDGFWLPYRRDHDEIRSILKEAVATRGSRPSVLFAHMGIAGAWMNNLMQDEDGFGSDELATFGFKRVFLGHYHRHHMLRKGMVYVGSPYQVSYAEAGQPKGVMTWDGKRAEFHEWGIGPRHHKVVFDADNPAPMQLGNVREGDKLWVVVKGQMAGAAHAVVQDALAKAGLEPARIEIDAQPVEQAARIEVKPGESLADVARRFVEAQDVDPSYKAMLAETFKRVIQQ